MMIICAEKRGKTMKRKCGIQALGIFSSNISNHWKMFAAALVGVLSFVSSSLATPVSWRSEAANGNWDGGTGCGEVGEGSPSHWWYSDWSPNRARGKPDCFGNHQVSINNNDDTTMTLNNGSWYNVNTLTFGSGASSAHTINGIVGVDYRDSGAKIQNDATGTKTFNHPIAFNVNPVQFRIPSGGMTFNSNIFFKSNFLDIYGANGHTLNLNGRLRADSGNGGVAIKEYNLVNITNDNDITGAIWVEKGLLTIGGHTNAIGLSGFVNVGTNATLDLNYGAARLRPASLSLYGTGTNSAAGAVRKTSTGTTRWTGAVTNFQDAKIVVTAGGIEFHAGIVAGANTLYITNSAAVEMSGGELSASKTGGDGAIHKSGTSFFQIRPGSGFTGDIMLHQGEIRMGTGTMPSGGHIFMNGNSFLSSDGTAGRTVDKAISITGNVGLAMSSSGNMVFTNTINLGGAARIVSNANGVAFTAIITNGGLTKAGAGIMTNSAVNTYAGDTRIAAGTLVLANQDAMKNSQLDMNSADSGTLAFGSSATYNFASLTGSRDLLLGTNKTINVGSNNTSTTYSGKLGGTGSALTKSGTGTFTLTAISTNTGNTLVDEGVLIMNGTNLFSSFAVKSGAYMYGTGNVASLTVTGQFSAGDASNTVGHARATTMIFPNSGRMQVNASSLSGTPGVDIDLVTLNAGSGTFTVNATDGSDFIIALKGNPSFSSSLGYTNVIVDAGGNTGFDTTKFSVDTAEFTPSPGIVGFFVDTNSAGDITLVYVPATAPNVNVLGNNTLISDGSTTPSYADHTDFGDALADGGTVTRTFTVTNSGTATLNIGNVYTNGGGNPGDFIVTAQPGSYNLAAGATTTFQVQFNPTDVGIRFADIEFTNNVSSAKNPYTFRIQGTGTYVEVAVSGNANNIGDGSTAPAASNHTEFGSVGTAGSTLSRTYTITNSGNRAMTLGNVTTSGTHAADFIVTTQPSGTLNPSNSTTFVVQFNPSANGLRTASLSFSTTDDAHADGLTENPFNFDIQGTGAGTGISNFPTSLNFSSVLGSAPSPAFQAFGITNVGLGTLTYSLTTNASWLSVSNVSGSAAAGAGNVHTAIVSLVSGLAAGTSNATITITGTDGFTTNSPKTIAVAWTISAIPDPTAQSATADGAEMIRLAWTPNGTYNNVLIVYQSGGAVSTDPTQGTSYNVGGSIGSGVVVYKGTASAFEHIVATGTAHHYKFYSINNNYYSPGLTANATTLSYLSGEIVEQFGYTNAVTLNALGGGQGWTSGWTLNVPNTNTHPLVNNVNFSTFQSSWPTERGNRFVFNTAATVTYEAFRGIGTVNCGKIYVAGLVRRQFDEGDGDAKFQVFGFMNGSTEVAHVGKRGAGNDQFGTRSGGDNDLFGAANSFANATDYLVIGCYDFDSGVMSGIFYDNATSVPSNEPTYLVTSTDTPAGQITGIRIAAGSAVNGWPGECHFDEIRVARNWGDLLNLLTPKVTNYSVDADNIVTDGQVTNGTYEVRADLFSSAGVDTDGTPVATTFDFLNPSGTAVINDDTFGYFTYNSASSVTATDVNHAISYANNALGVYTMRVTTVSSNGGRIVDNKFVGNACTGTVMTFTVNDDDTAAPTFGTFYGLYRDISGTIYTNDEFAGGFWVTGTVTDAGSGLFAASNTFTLSRDGSVVSSGVFAVNFVDGGATSGGLVSNNFPLATMIAGAYTLTVFTVDYDVDRPLDQLKSTNVFSFSVVEPASAPGLGVTPLTLTYEAMLGSDPAVLSTFTVTNFGVGTLYYTNYQTYGTASGWFAANPTNNSLGATGSRIHTGQVATATFNSSGTFIATNRVHGNQTNAAQEIVVTLVVSNIPSPTAVTAQPSGAEFVMLRWTETSGRQVMIVSRQTNAPTDPSNGTAYSVGNSVGGGTVIFKGTGSYFEQVVQPGSTNFYNFYAINNDRYSLVTTVGATTEVYRAGEVIEPFAYTNGASLNGFNGGTGWTNAWTVTQGSYNMQTQQFASMSGYPSDAANTVTGNNARAFRGFPAITGGKAFLSFKVKIADAAATFSGVSFFNADNSTEIAYFGESGSFNNQFSAGPAGSTTVAGANTFSNNTEYLIIGMADFDADKIYANIYTNGFGSVGASEPTAAQWTISAATAFTATRIDRIRIASSDGAIWDEIRIATSWDDLLRTAPTYVWDAEAGPANRDWSNRTNWVGNVEPTATNHAFIGGSYTGVVTQAGEVADDLYLGQSAAGTLLQTAGTLGVDNFLIGYSNNAVGVYQMSGGSLAVGASMVVGGGGTGTAIVHGAGSKISVAGDIHVGLSNSINRSAFVHNAGTVTAANVYIGKSSGTEGRYTMSNGVLVVGTDIFLADGNANSTGRLEVSGGRIDSGNINVGRNGLGLMTVSGTATINVIGANSDIIIGDLSSNNRSNRLTISGGQVNIEDNIELGDAANTFGNMLMNGGLLNVTGQVFVGDASGSTGEVTFAGGTANITGAGGAGLVIGNGGLGTVYLSAGTLSVDDIQVGSVSGSRGYLIITNGTLTSSESMIVGNSTGTGVLQVVGNSASITIGDGTTEDLTFQTGAELSITFVNGALTPIYVQDDITAAGTISITNIGTLTDGTYLVATSQNRSAISGTFAATNWLGDQQLTVNYINNAITITIVSQQEIAILGTNGAVIVSGDTTPSTADGTDYGNVNVTADTKTHVFSITNSGGLNLTVSGVTTSGTGAADFEVLSWPAIVSPYTVSNFTIRFNPSVAGLVTATVTVANNDSNEGTYTFTVQGTGTEPGILQTPTSLSVTTMKGTTPSASTFTVTNVGTGTLTFDITTNASWLSVAPVSGTLAAGAGQTQAVTYAVGGLQAGVSNATITITSANATNSPQTVTVALTITNIPAPTAYSATNDGSEMVRANWTSSFNVLIVHRAAAAPSADPADNTAYSVGDSLGGGTVVYSGSGVSLEHIVATGSTNFYRFYSINNNHYSPYVESVATTTVYRTGEIVEQFAYTNNITFSTTQNGGQGWASAWNILSGTWVAKTNGEAVFINKPNYPSNHANRIRLNNPGNGNAGQARRDFATPYTTGTVYVAALMAYEFQGADKFAGINFLSNGTSKAFFGEVGHDDKKLGLGGFASSNVTASYNFNDFNTDLDNIYLVVGAYTFATRELKVAAFYKSTTVPLDEPAVWDAYGTVPSGHINMIDGIRLHAGSTGSGSVGDVLYDELRVASSWGDLIAKLPVVVTNFSINGGVNLTDAQITSGAFAVTAHLYSRGGVETTNTSGSFFIPNFDLVNSAGTVVLNNQNYGSFTYLDAITVLASNSSHAGAAPANVTLGVYTSRVSAISSNGVSMLNTNYTVNGSNMTFTVVDDDSGTPQVDNHNYGAVSLNSPLRVVSNGSAVARSGTTTNRLWELVDGYLAILGSGGTNVLDMSVGGSDSGSGISRSESGNDTNAYISLSIGTVVTNTMTNFVLAASSTDAETFNQGSTNVFRFRSPFSTAQIDNLYDSGSNVVRVTIPDNDVDRTGDRSVLYSSQVGFLVIIDDDTTAPVAQNFNIYGALGSYTTTVAELSLGSGWAITGRVNDAFSGINVNGTSTTQPNISPYFELWDPAGVMQQRQVFDTITFANGGATALTAIGDTTNVSVGTVVAGTWTARVVVADADADRTGDRIIVTNSIPFVVVETPVNLVVSPTNFTVTLMKGNSDATSIFAVTNTSAGTLYYTNTITYGSGSGWLTVAPANATNGALANRLNTGTVSAVSQVAGTYVATNRITGNQTNGNPWVTFTLVVTNIPDPTAVSATDDGPEMVRLAWTEAGLNSFIVHRSGAAPTDPTDNTSYNVGDSVGSGTVIFKGSGSALEHIVSTGTTNYYRFYSINNNHYSPGVQVAATTTVYAVGEILEQFAYTNGVVMSGLNGGQGWTNTWSVSAPDAPTDIIITNSDFTAFQANWPTERANRMVLRTTNNSTYTATRNVAAYSSGKVYVAALYRRQFNEGADGKFSGIRLLSGGSEQAFFGERGGVGNDDVFGVSSGSSVGNAGASDSFPAATEYLIIGRYDFDTDILSGIYYDTATAVPSVEPTFAVMVTNAITSLDGIQLVSGAANGWNGQVHFDEVRVAATWQELLRLAGAPFATNYNIGNATNYVSDGNVQAGTFPVVMNLRSQFGIETTNTVTPFFIPNFDLWSSAGVQVVTNYNFGSFSYQDSGLTAVASNTTHATVVPASVVLGIYTGRFSAIASNSTVTIDRAHLSNGTAMAFTVFDDDTLAPDLSTIQSTNNASFRNLHVSIGASAVSGSGAGTNIAYSTDDGTLVSIAATNPLIFWAGAVDTNSGLARGTSGAATNTSFTVGSAIISNVANFDSTRSSDLSGTTNTRATNVWTWSSAFSATDIDNFVTNTAYGYGTNRVMITLRDADFDRGAADQSSTNEQQIGLLVVTDDDTTAPTIQNFRLFGANGSYTASVAELLSGVGWAITGRVSDSGSGINVNGTSTTQPDISPYFELWDSSGVMQLRHSLTNLSFIDGGATTLSSVGATNPAALISAPIGVWTAKVVVADNDEDRTNDRTITTNEFTFEVVIGDSQTSLVVSPNLLNATSRYGVVTGGGTWPNFYVTNNGIGTLIYSATISYNGGSGWLTVSPSAGVSVGTAGSQIHTNSIDTSSLNPGTYQAVIALAGNQTNGTRYVTNNLTVIGYYVNEIVDQFTNTAGGSLNGATGGTGWTNAWNSSTFTFDSGNLSVPVNYPANSGNKICGSTASEISARRHFPAVTTGKLFAAVAIQKDANNNNGFAGLTFMNGSSGQAYGGKIFNSPWVGIDFGGVATEGTFGLYQSVYMIVLYYDFDNDTIRVRAFNPGDTLSLTEPGSWQVTRTNASISSIDGISLSGSAVGNLCFDEIRVARTWETLLNQFTAEPTLHATAMTFANVTTNSMTVGWTPGNGAARIVVAREGQAVSFAPGDGTNYSANADFVAGTDLGDGNKVIYNGSGSSVPFTSLTTETQYFFKVFEYNNGPNYLTSGTPLSGSRWTLKIEPSEAVTNLNAYTVSSTTISNTWTVPGGTYTPDGYLIIRNIGSLTTNIPTDGVAYTNDQIISNGRVAVVTPGSLDTFLQSNMTACSTYHFSIYGFRRNASAFETVNYNSSTTATASASTSCTEPTMQASNIVFDTIATNFITLSWENGNGERRMVVVRQGATITSDPVNGQSYTSSATFGSGTQIGSGNYVVYRNTGTTVTVTGLSIGQTYTFKVYEFNGSGGGSQYNTNNAVNNPRTTASASFGIVEEKFNYGNFENLSGKTGGTGWTNGWVTVGALVESSNYNLPAFGAYPADTGTKSGFMDMSNSATPRSAYRNFPARTSGRLYFAIKINNAFSMASGDYIGVDILNGTSTTGFFGKASGVADRRLAVSHNGSVRTNQLDGSNSGYQINSGVDYLLVAMYDFDTKDFNVRAYTTDQLAHADPDGEAAWNVEMQNVNIDRIDGIKFVASDNNQIVGFDHIRIGPSWEEVMFNLPDNWHDDNGPVPTLVYIGTNYNSSFYGQVITNLSDAELKDAGLIDFAVRWDSAEGLFLTNSVATNRNIGSPNARVSPNWDPLAVGAATNQFNLDRYFTNFFGANNGTVVTTFQYQAFNITNIDFVNQYFVTVSAETEPGGATVAAPNGGSWDAVPVARAITINESLRFYVYDDDTNTAVRGANGMAVLTNSTATSVQAFVDDLRRHFVTDGVLASNGMDVSIRAYDEYSGIQRTVSGAAATNMSLTLAGMVTNDTDRLNLSRSSSGTTASSTTNTWSFSNTNFTWQRITDLWGGDGSGSQGQDVDVTATIPDADADRVDDQATLSNALFGVIRISDDDVDAPYTTNIAYGAGTVNNRPFYVGTNGLALGSGDTLIRGTYDRRSGTGADTIFAMTDEEMASSGSRNLEFIFGSRDNHSGISRGATGNSNTVMSFSISNILSGVVTGFNSSLSSANIPNATQSNIWTFADGTFNESVITQLMAITTDSGASAAPVMVTIPDNDYDRSNDYSFLYGERVGYVQVFDDDVAGPTMNLVDVPQSTGGDSILATSFETSQGWPVSALSSTITWTNTDSYGSWIGEGVLHTSLDPKNSGTRRIGFLTNTFASPWLQLPPVNNPGSLVIYGARVGGGSGTPLLALERWDGAAWVGHGTNAVDTTTYQSYSWNVNESSSNVLLRLRRVDTGTTRSQLYADDISLTAVANWIGTNALVGTLIDINWTAAADDYSGIAEYRLVAPGMSTTPPTTTNDGANISSSATNTLSSIAGQQGVLTGFIFAVDNDADRSNDRTMGNVARVVIQVDTNPPVAVQEASTVVDATIDDTTEIKVIWSNHVSSARAAGYRQSDEAALSPWDSYIIQFHELDISSPTTVTLTRATASWTNVLNNHLFTNMILSNLNFDARYEISVMGRDMAGNIGPAVTVTGVTTIFSVTQGFNRVDTDLEIQWIWNEERTYDIVHVDAMSMSDSFTNMWEWVTTITNAGWMCDTGNVALERARPTTLSDTMRFYRVSRQGAWTTNNALRRGSVEVYVTKPLNLYTGENWHSTFFIPDTATVAYVFSTNILPRGDTFAEATKISWFDATAGGSTNQNGAVTAVVWLASSTQWLYQVGGTLNANANNMLIPLNQGFLIEIPGNPQTNQSKALSMMIIGLVPTQEVTQVIAGGTSSSNRIHILSHNMPVRVGLSSMGIRGSGFVGNNNGVLADEVRILSQGGHGSLQNPKARIRLRSDGTTWQYYTTPGSGAAADPANYVIEPDDAVIIIRRNAAAMTWTNRLLYTPPTKNFTP